MCVAAEKSPYKKVCPLFAILPSCKLGCRYDGWYWNSHQTMEWKSHFKKQWNKMKRMIRDCHTHSGLSVVIWEEMYFYLNKSLFSVILS